MNRFILSIVILVQLFVGKSFAQTAIEADEMFAYFEYEKAASLYEQKGLDQLTTQQLENLAMSYYHTFNGKKGITVANMLIEKNPKLANYYLWKSRFLKENGEFEEAKNATETYQELGGIRSVELFKESCDLWLNNPQVSKGNLENSSLNDTRANFQSIIGNRVLFFRERALDKDFEEVSSNDNLSAEVFLLTPYFLENGNLVEWKMINEPGTYYSVSSVQVSHLLQKVYFSAAMPLATNQTSNQFQIFEADFHGFDVAVSNIHLWKNALGNDSSSCSQLTLSPNEKNLVFSKIGKSTQGADLYFSEIQNENWSLPMPLSNLNTTGDDVFPSFNGDSLFSFSSNGRKGFGELDIYYARMTGQLQDLLEIQHAPLPINSSADDFYFYKTSQDSTFFSSNRRLGKGDDDLWTFVSEPVIISVPEPEPVVEVAKVLNIDSLLNEWNKERAHVGFDKDDSEENFSYLNDLKELMKQGYTFRIEVIGSADNRGTEEYNDALGLRRAEARRDLMIQDGIPSEILEVKTIGAKEPVADCPQRGKCPESVHEQNRFVRLRITQVK